MHADVDLHDIVGAQRHLVAGIGRVVGRDVVEVEPGREAHAGHQRVALGQALVPDQRARRVLDAVGDVRQRLARLDVALRPLAHLAVRLGRMAVVGEEVGVEPVQVALLLARRAVAVLAGVLDLLARRVSCRWGTAARSARGAGPSAPCAPSSSSGAFASSFSSLLLPLPSLLPRPRLARRPRGRPLRRPRPRYHDLLPRWRPCSWPRCP